MGITFKSLKRKNMFSSTGPYFRSLLLIAGCFLLFPGKSFTHSLTDPMVRGVVLESGTNKPLAQAVISVSVTGENTQSDEHGKFELKVPDLFSTLAVNLPGYTRRRLTPEGQEQLTIYLVQERFSSFDDLVSLPLESKISREVIEPVSSISGDMINSFPGTPADGLIQGMLPGLHVVRHSGFPGHKAWLNVGGISSMYAKQQPLLIVDGMIHEYNYANQSVISGFSFNPWDIVDVDDIADITLMNGSLASWGSNGSNGVIYISTEKRSEASSEIIFNSYGGIGLMPEKISLLNADQFRSLFSEQIIQNGQTPEEYGWLTGDPSDPDFFRYNNSTNWQDELFRPSAVQKYHVFLKGGDEIATYNISTGYLKHGSIYENSSYSRYNLRINGKINITDRFSVVPNVKLSLSDSYVASMGAEEYKNPLTSSLLKSPLMAPMARDPRTGAFLNEIDDVGIFSVSNPIAIVAEGMGSNRNYHFLSSVDFSYRFNPRLTISSLTGISYNNARESLFLPGHGLVNQEFADNSRHDLVYDFRSTQNHSKLTYKNTLGAGSLIAVMGFRYLKNNYKFNIGNDLNTPSDDFRNLGQGARYQYLRTTVGDDRELVWGSVYSSVNYSINNKYYIEANYSFDGNSNINKNNRYNHYPSLGVAWRISSEPFLSAIKKAGDLKLRASYGLSGNMHSQAYDYSKLFYVGRRLGSIGVLVRDAVPNTDLAIEKKSTLNAGFDFMTASLRSYFSFNYYHSTVNNLLINQQLPAFGFENYFDNGGVLNINAFELAFQSRTSFSSVTWTYGLSASRYVSKMKDLQFIDEQKNSIIHQVGNIDDIRVFYLASKNNGLNLFYGYQTDGNYALDSEAQSVTGPGGVPMREGDIRFVDQNGDNIINALDMTVIGDPNPDLYGGIHTSLIFKNIEVGAFVTYSYGNDIFNYLRFKTESMSNFYNQTTETQNRWGSQSQNGTIPGASMGDPTGNTVFSDRWIEDGSYLRLKNLSVSYTLPSSARLYQHATIYLTGTNLITFTRYEGYDPEVYYENSPFQMGIDYGKIPQVRTFLLGLRLSI